MSGDGVQPRLRCVDGQEHRAGAASLLALAVCDARGADNEGGGQLDEQGCPLQLGVETTTSAWGDLTVCPLSPLSPHLFR